MSTADKSSGTIATVTTHFLLSSFKIYPILLQYIKYECCKNDTINKSLIPAQHQHSGKMVDMIRHVMLVSDCSHGLIL
nr:MAG TPA: hypothetical protein [Caudoviricetes sp.]